MFTTYSFSDTAGDYFSFTLGRVFRERARVNRIVQLASRI